MLRLPTTRTAGIPRACPRAATSRRPARRASSSVMVTTRQVGSSRARASAMKFMPRCRVVASTTMTRASGALTVVEVPVRTSWTICSSGLIGSRE